MYGVLGTSKGSAGVGVVGESDIGDGVVGRGHRGVVGESDEFQGVFGHSRGNAGVVGDSDEFHGAGGDALPRRRSIRRGRPRARWAAAGAIPPSDTGLHA